MTTRHKRGIRFLATALFFTGFTNANLASAAQYEWTFSQGNLSPSFGGSMAYADATTASVTTFGSTGGGIPNINGQVATFMHVPALTGLGNGYQLTLDSTGPNGGGSYVNRYTVVYDIYVPSPLNWTALLNTDPVNSSGNDADFYIAPDGSVGIGTYSAAGVIAANNWYRLAFAADLAANTLSFYVNGTLVKQNTGATLDGRWSLYSNADAGPDLLLFNEGDTGGQYTHELYVNSIYFTDRTMTPAELTALGGPNAAGIAVPEPGTWTLLGLSAITLVSCRRLFRQSDARQ